MYSGANRGRETVRRLFVVAALLFALLTPVPGSGECVIDLNTNQTTGPAPLAVKFDAIGTTHDTIAAVNTFGQLHYSWNFDDTASGTWTPTGNSRNVMTGPMAAHVFEPTSFTDCGGNCAEYTVQVTASGSTGVCGNASVTIQVLDPDSSEDGPGWGGINETACVSNSSDFTGCPLTCDTSHPVPADKAYCYESPGDDFDADLGTLIGVGYRRILFKGGDSWTWDDKYTLFAVGPGLIGSYGTGDPSIGIGYLSTGFSTSGDDWRVQDLSLTGSYAAEDVNVFTSSKPTDNLLIQRITVADGAAAVIATFSPNNLVGKDAHSDLFIVDNDWGRSDTYQLYGTFNGAAVLGNTFDGTEEEHTFRFIGGEKLLISNNYVGPIWPGGTGTNQFRDISTSCTDLTGVPYYNVPLRYILFQDNHVEIDHNYGVKVGMRTCASKAYPAVSHPQYDIIIERNYFETGTHPVVPTQAAYLTETAEGVTYREVIRNNVVNMDGFGWANTGLMAGSDTVVYGNTCYRNDSYTAGTDSECISGTANECYNNVMFAPNWSTPQDAGWHSGSCTTQSNNMDDADEGSITQSGAQLFEDWTNRSEIEDLTPAVGSQLIDAGTDVPELLDDALMNARPYGDPTGDYDVGAVER